MGGANNKYGGSCLRYYAYGEMVTVKSGVRRIYGRERKDQFWGQLPFSAPIATRLQVTLHSSEVECH